ncbi:hypothetical protein DL98DRAFT_524609 [Cadophora sp. DSE1049]|nr:hypothetical protein DL98DRAFT_524609 [Cadophora sp. DSE1049]
MASHESRQEAASMIHHKSENGQLRACLECQKRKSKCTGETPCAFCARTQRNCVYMARPIRTPLTRKNLDAAEQKCDRLTALLRSLNPDVDIENLLKNGIPSTQVPTSNPSPKSPQQIDQASPGSSHDYEWHEAPLSNDLEQAHSSKDGMALLSTDPSESGYLGSSAGSSMLQTIFSLLSLKGPLDEPSRAELSKLMVTRHRSDSGLLVLEEDLASSAITDGLIDAYFLLYNTSYPILHSQLFRETYANRSQLPNTSSWQLVFYTVLAIGHWVLSAGEDHADSPYYLAARSRMSAGMLESGTLTGVQAFLLMGNYLQKRDRPNTGYNMIGIAFRMALGLGLHREISTSDGEHNTLSKEIRRRVWWILYMVDSGFSITMGRPTTASDAFIDVKLPQNIEDSHLTSDELGLPLAPPVNYPTACSAMIAQAQLSIIANKIYNEFLAAHISNAIISEDLAYKFEAELQNWKSNLPDCFIDAEASTWFYGPRAVIFWKEQNLRMMLWRGGQRSNRTRPRSEVATQNCILVAIESVDSICSFSGANDRLHQGLSWYATYFLFQAVLVIDYALLQSPDDVQSSVWRESINKAHACFSKLGITNPAALRCIAVLDRIHSHHLSLAATNNCTRANSQDPDPLSSSLPEFGDFNSPSSQMEYSTHQAYAADPALQFFLDGPPMNNLFDGVYGFPSTQEQENFDYIPGDFYNLEDFDMSLNWHENS